MQTGECTNTQEHERAGLYTGHTENDFLSCLQQAYVHAEICFVIAVSYQQVSLSVLDQAACPPTVFPSCSSPESVPLPSLTKTLPLNNYQTPESPKTSSHSKTESTTANPKAL